MIGAQFQKAIFDALNGASVAGGRIYDEVPGGATFPYVTIGDEQIVDDSNSCAAAWEIYADVHCWSRPTARSKVEVKTVAAAVVSAVTGISSVTGHTLIGVWHDTTRVLDDPDGLTKHAVVTFRALVDPA